VGDVISLDLGSTGSDEWQIVGTYRVIFSSGFETESFYAPLAAVEAATGLRNQATRAYLQSGSTTLEQALAISDALRERFEDANIKVDLYTSSVTLEERLFALNQFSPVVSTLLGLASLLASVGAIGLASALSISVMERTREIGVLRAIGARGRTLMALFVIEGVLQSLLSWALAVPLALLIARPLAWQLGQVMLDANLDYAFSWPAVLVWLAVTTGIGVVAALQPARSAARLSVRESLSYA
jgi:putative ABC transport system permease protein